jgi:uridine kinase
MLKPIGVSLDDYFVERDKTPLDEFGEKDYESLYALDLDLFEENLLALMNGTKWNCPAITLYRVNANSKATV